MSDLRDSKTSSVDELIELITSEIATVTGIPASKISIDQGFMEMGIESLQAVAIIENLSLKLHENLNVELLFDHPNIQKLAIHLELESNLKERKIIAERSISPGADELLKSEKEIFENTDISIVGMSCRFPKANGLLEFYDLLLNGRSGIDSMTKDRLKLHAEHRQKEMGFVEAIENFASDAFSISSHEANLMDPQQRMLLEECNRALEDAGYTPKDLQGSHTGVFIGVSNSDYAFEISKSSRVDIFTSLGNAHSIVANRISYFYDLKGPSLAVDTACSSSLVALHMAVQSLARNEIEMAIVGGVNSLLSSEITNAFWEAGMLSPDSRCFTFSKEANGYVRGEGVGVIVLRRSKDMVGNSFRSYAKIKATAINQDGKSSGLTAPNGSAQESALREALLKANLNPEEISYHEAHGTATALGDPIELLALERIHKLRLKDQPLLIGSVKTNIGHLESAAGIASVIKVALGLYYKKIFKNLNFSEINPQIKNRIASLEPVLLRQDWSSRHGERLYASLSSFGFGGTNACAILAEADMPFPQTKTDIVDSLDLKTENKGHIVFAWSANSQAAVRNGMKNLLNQVKYKSWDEAAIYAQASIAKRRFFKDQILVNVSSKKQLQDLSALFQDSSIDLSNIENIREFKKQKLGSKRIAFLFTGQGAQYSQMYYTLYEDDILFKSLVDEALQEAQIYYPKNLYQVWTDARLVSDLDQTDYSQILLFALALSFAKYLKIKFNVEPEYSFGHSLGEITAAAFAGAFDLKTSIQMVACRARLMWQTQAGAMTAVFEAKTQIESILIKYAIELDISAINGPRFIVLSGPENEIIKLETGCDKERIKYVRLKPKQGFHSRLMDPILQEYQSALNDLSFEALKSPIVSSLTGDLLPEGFHYKPEYWLEQMRRPTQFDKALATMQDLKVTHFIEIGPEPQLIGMAKLTGKNKPANWVHFFDKQLLRKSFVEASFFLFENDLTADADFFKKSQINIASFLPKTILSGTAHWHSFEDEMKHKTRQHTDAIKSKDALTPAFNRKENQMEFLNPNEALQELEVQKELVQIVASVMRVSIQDISLDESLVDIGADSLVLMNAVQTIKETYEVSIPISEVFKDLNNLRKIANFIVNESPVIQSRNPVEESLSSSLPQFESSNLTPEVVKLFQNQIAIMNRQLEVLGLNASAQKLNVPNQQILPPEKLEIANLGKEKRGVLGNFKNFANLEAETESDRMKNRFLNRVIAEFNAKTPKTKTHVQKYRKQLADNRVSAGFRPNTKEMIYPIHCLKAKGSKFIDLDGNEFTDFSMGFGVNLFGHSPDFIEAALLEQMKNGMCLGPQSFLAGDVASQLSELTGLERVAFVNSGTEAVMTAVRLARAGTKRSKIVIFDGSYHGHFDGILARPSRSLKSHPVAAGISESLLEDVIVLEYGSARSLEIIEEMGENLAGVLVEPVQSRFPEFQPQAFLQKLREITKRNGTAFIWDEVITGFRIHPGGAQAHFEIQADIATYGKILGGGMPIGAVAGSAKYLDFIDGGHWQFGDQSYPSHEMTFFAGTFSKHPLAMAAANAVLLKLKQEGKELIESLNEKTTQLCRELNSYFKEQYLAIELNNYGSLFRFKAALNLDLFFTLLNSRGFYVWEGRNLFLSTAHSAEDIQNFKQAVVDITGELLSEGILVPQKPALVKPLSLSLPQARFANLSANLEFGNSASLICVSAKVKGFLDIEKLKLALQILQDSHDLFNLRVNINDKLQEFSSLASPVDFEFLNYRSEKSPWKILDQELNMLAQTNFDLTKSPGILVRLFEVAVDTHVLAVITHHLVFDGWTMTLYFEELARIYNSLLLGTTPAKNQQLSYEQFLNQSSMNRVDEKLLSAKSYWENEFAEILGNQAENSVAIEKSLKGQRIVFDLELKLYKALKLWAREHKMTAFMFLFGCFAKALMTRLHKNEIVIGIPVANRDYPGSEKMFGNCVNLLPVKIQNSEPNVEAYFAYVKSKILNAYQNMNYPYEKLIASAGPLFDTYFNLEPTSDLPEFDQASLIIHPFPIAASEYKLMLNITDFEHYYHCEFDFQNAKLSDDEILEMIDDLKAQIKAVVTAKSVAGPKQNTLSASEEDLTP